jgi:hypothetical protein
MEKKYFETTIFYSGFCTYKIEAANENEAIIKARTLPVNNNEILFNLENWEEADTAEEFCYEEN